MDWLNGTTTTLALTTLVKIAIAVSRMLNPEQSAYKIPIIVGVVSGAVFAFGFLFAQSTPITIATSAQAFIQGGIATGVALGIVEPLETRAAKAVQSFRAAFAKRPLP